MNPRRAGVREYGPPPDDTFPIADAGTQSLSATFWTVGAQGLTATDDANDLGGTLGIKVLPA